LPVTELSTIFQARSTSSVGQTQLAAWRHEFDRT